MKAQCPILEIAKENFQLSDLSKSFPDSINLPFFDFPPSFRIEEKNYFCGGYFVCYNRSIPVEKVVSSCRTGDWNFLISLIADFFIIFCNYETRELFVLTDQFGKFPCFFSFEDSRLVLSTNFALVNKKLSKRTLDLYFAFDYISRSIWQNNRTFVQEIKQLPAGCLLEIKVDFSSTVTSLVDLKGFLKKGVTRYSSSQEFSEDFLSLFSQIILERLGKIDNRKFFADISSGFDTNLVCYVLSKIAKKPFVCYSGISELTYEDTHPDIVKAFAEKHNLDFELINVDDLWPFSHQEELQWIREYPTQALQYEIEKYIMAGADKDCSVKFTGDGGDEVYWSCNMEKTEIFPIQREYFFAVWKIDMGMNQLLTQKGVDLLLEKKRFREKREYPLIVPSSAVKASLGYFPIARKHGVWLMTPFMDPRLIQLSRGIPFQKEQPLKKIDVWRGRTGIFLPEQFVEKGGPEKRTVLYLEKSADFIISALSRSRLGDLGLIKAEEIAKDIKQGHIGKYSEAGKDTLFFLIKIVELEYFLQQNGIRVPDSYSLGG